MPSEDVLLNVAQVRERLNCSRSHVYSLAHDGELRVTYVGKKRGLRIYSSSLEKYIRRRAGDRAA